MLLENNRYSIQGIDILELCRKYGTPIYVYDSDKIIEKINVLRNAFSGIKLGIKYAAKANTNLSILKLMKQQGVDLDVVSPQEIELGLVAGYSPNQIMFTSSGVSFDEIKFAVKKGILPNIDNLPTLEKFGKTYGGSVPCVLRIKPNVMGGGNIKISTGHKDSKFGIAIEQEEKILSLKEKYNLNIVGLHQHTGSDIKDGQTFVDATSRLMELAYNFPDLQLLDFGGGFKVAYQDGELITDMNDLGQKLGGAFREFCKNYGRELELWFEPGKFLVSESGFLFAKANVVKHNPNRSFVGLNTGLNRLIRPMMYDAYHHILNVSNPKSSEKKYNIVGYICETDTFATDRPLPKVKTGDILAFLNAGAYGFSMASQYNSRFRPAEILIHKKKAYLIRKRETLKDIFRNQILADF